MAKKLYIFGIGGTGSRVIKALSMLFAAGVKLENGFDTVIPIIIDPDTSNGDLNRTKDILRLYQEIRNQVKDPDDFYRQEVKTVNELATKNKTISPDYFQFKLDGVDNSTFGQYIGFDSLSEDYKNSKDDKNFVRQLYSESNLNSDLSVGFKGNPNMGSIILNQFTNSEDFKRFGQTFGSEDAIFIINSIFGGTGAAGFPLLLKNLRGNDKLLNHAQIKDAPIGGITYLPYFTLDKQGEVNAESFEEKAKIAIDYYNRTIINQRKINVLHFIGNRGNTNAEAYAVGGSDQKNRAHFLEIAGSLAIIEFCKNIAMYSCSDGKTTQPTQIKEFGIERDNENISFDDLNIENKNQFYKPLAKFRLYTQYLHEGLKRAKNVSRWTKSNFFVIIKHKKSPCNESYFAGSEYKNQISAFNSYFREWIKELSENKPAFNPFFEVVLTSLYKKIDTQNCLEIDNLKLRSDVSKHTTLVKVFGLSTEKVYKNLPIRVSESSEKVIKVFRLHQGQEGTGWFISKPLEKDNLKTIKTEGKDVATSIPSPFARIDLVKSAFDWITYQVKAIVAAYQKGDLISNEDRLKIKNIIEGKTAQHKIVSDALDVAQLFYKCQNYEDKIEIITWNPNERFKDLINNSQNRKHSKFAETLKIFWEQDSVAPENFGNLTLYNFEHVNRLYFVINKTNRKVIGGTSPATLFYAAPDVREHTKNLNIVCGQNKLFDDIYFPLHKREVSFVEYIYAFAKQNDNFAIYFPEFNSYLEQVKDYLLLENTRTVVSALNANSIGKYKGCPVLNNKADLCEVINLRLGVPGIEGNSIENESDFVIKSDFEDFSRVWDKKGQKYNETLKLPDASEIKPRPLVLPYDKFTKKWTYTTRGILWNENTKIPFKNANNLILPVQGDQYPWLTVGNFLEEKIIELPYSIDSIKFKTCGAKKHLLPLNPTFFRFFSIEKVDRYLKLEERAGGGIEAILEIPVKEGNISYKKIYHQEDIVKLDIHLAILPFLKPVKSKLDYTIGVIDDRLDKSEDVSVKCYEKGVDIKLSGTPIIRNPGINDVKSFYYKTSKTFDTVHFGLSSFRNFIVPNLPLCSENDQITFAIDFGTTNTHIEYTAGKKATVPLENSESLPLWQSIINRKDQSLDPRVIEREKTFEIELMPYTFSTKNSEIQFPLRTALVFNKQTDFSNPLKNPVEVFKHTNNYLLYEKRCVPKHYLKSETQLKWSNYAEAKDEIKVENYIEYLINLVYYKTLLLDGDPKSTKIIWFYPVSMEGSEDSSGELGVFVKLWKGVYKKVFRVENCNNLIQVPESIAPYLYYKHQKISGLSLSIDIGGGSSDVAVFDENSEKALLISSFKFAGNAIFGDGYSTKGEKSNSDSNGFVQTFKEQALQIALEGYKEIIEDIFERKDSADFSSFLFSLEQDNNNQFSYTRLIQKNKRLKLSIMVFYGAVAYYSANLLLKAGIEIPKNILLSGTAAKTASILDSSSGNLKNLSAMFKYIFEKVYNKTIDKDIVLEVSEIPKEITCKGALDSGINESITENVIKFWLGGFRDDKWCSALDKEKDIKNTPKYKDIDASVKASIKEAIFNFYKILDNYTQNVRFESKYLIEQSAYEKFKEIRDDDIDDYLIRGLKAFYKNEDKHIEETLFFYPLIGILNKLTYELSKKEV